MNFITKRLDSAWKGISRGFIGLLATVFLTIILTLVGVSMIIRGVFSLIIPKEYPTLDFTEFKKAIDDLKDNIKK